MAEQPQSRYVQMPDNSYVEWPEGVSAADFKAKMAGKFGNAPEGMETVPKSDVAGSYMRREPENNEGFLSGLFRGPAETLMHPLISASSQGQPFVASGMAPGGMYPTTMSSRPADLEANRNVQLEAQQENRDAARAIRNNPGYAAGSFVGNAALGALVGGTAGLAKGIGGGIIRELNPLREYPFLPRDEAIARAATETLKPGQYETGNVRSGLIKYLPYIQAESGGGEYENPLHFAKTSSAAGEKQTGIIKNLVEQASQNDPIIAQNYADLYKINQQLRPLHRSRTVGEMLTKEQEDNMQALEAKHAAMSDNFYSRLSEQTGMPREQIAEINQRGGALQHIGDVVDWVQDARRQGRGPGGIPLTKTGLIDRGLEFLQGGPERIAGRQLTRLGKLVTPVENALPDLDALRENMAMERLGDITNAAVNRATAGQRIPAQPVTPGDITPAFDPTEELAAREERLAGRRANVAQRTANEAAADRAQRLVEQQRLAKAREQQRQAGVVREYRGGQ